MLATVVFEDVARHIQIIKQHAIIRPFLIEVCNKMHDTVEFTFCHVEEIKTNTIWDFSPIIYIYIYYWHAHFLSYGWIKIVLFVSRHTFGENCTIKKLREISLI